MYLQLLLKAGTKVPYGALVLSSIKGENVFSKTAYVIADDYSTGIPKMGAQIWDILNIKVMDLNYYPIYGNIETDKYLVVYTFDPKTGIINGFGQVKINSEDIGTECTYSLTQFENTTQFGMNSTDKYLISFGSIGENQSVTIGGIDVDHVSKISIPSTSPAAIGFLVNTADIAETGGSKTFTVTLSGNDTEANSQPNGTFTVKIVLPAPTPYLLKDPINRHMLNVTRVLPGSTINLSYMEDNHWVFCKMATAGSDGKASFTGLEAHTYYTFTEGPGIDQGSNGSDYVEITD